MKMIEAELPTPKVGYAGRYKMIVRHGMTDDIRYETPWFDNLITDVGLDMIGNGFSVNLYVGSSNSTPDPAVPAMGSLLAGTHSSSRISAGWDQDTHYYAWVQTKFTFGVGEVQGTVREVGVGPAPDGLFSRALLMDADGNPAELEVGGIDWLSVIYEYRQYAPNEEYHHTVDIAGVRDVIAKPIWIDDNVWRPRLGARIGDIFVTTTVHQWWWRDGDYTVFGDPPVNEPDGSRSRYRNSPALHSYTPGSLYRDMTLSRGPGHIYENMTALTVARVWANVHGVHFANGGMWAYAVNPGIYLEDFQRLEVTARISWGRHEP